VAITHIIRENVQPGGRDSIRDGRDLFVGKAHPRIGKSDIRLPGNRVGRVFHEAT